MSATGPSYVGGKRRLSVVFTIASTGLAADPTTVTLEVMSPAGTTTTLVYGVAAIVRDSAGAYHYDYGPFGVGDAGQWLYRWIGTGAVAAGTRDQTFKVEPTRFAA